MTSYFSSSDTRAYYRIHVHKKKKKKRKLQGEHVSRTSHPMRC